MSDLFFQSRRAPAAFGLYALLSVCCLGMIFALAKPGTEVSFAKEGSGLQVGDKILEIEGKAVANWEEVTPTVACIEPTCKDSKWDPESCMCSTSYDGPERVPSPSDGTLTLKIERGGQQQTIEIKDPMATQRAGDKRMLGARPKLPLTPWLLGALVFVMSLCVIGTHGLLSGTATMDFGGRKGAATAVGVIDGFVYAGTALQSVSLGYITTQSWAFWPMFLLPFGIFGTVLLTRIWHAKPKGRGGH